MIYVTVGNCAVFVALYTYCAVARIMLAFMVFGIFLARLSAVRVLTGMSMWVAIFGPINHMFAVAGVVASVSVMSVVLFPIAFIAGPVICFVLGLSLAMF